MSHSSHPFPPQQPPPDAAAGNLSLVSGLGFASILVGAGSILMCWIPWLGIAVSVGAIALGIAGIVLAMQRQGEGSAIPIIGSSISGVLLLIHVAIYIAASMATAQVDAFVSNIEKGRRESLEKAEAVSKGIVVSGASLQQAPEVPGVSPHRQVAFRLKNNTSSAIVGVDFLADYITPGRTSPWASDEDSHEIMGGIEPGEEVEIRESLYGDLSSVEIKPGAIVRVRILRAYGSNHKELAGRFGPEEEAELKKLRDAKK